MNAEILIPLSMFLCIFGIMYVFFTTRNKERLSMIEKGFDPAMFHTKKGPSNSNGNMSMRIGIFLIGIALGILTGNILTETTTLQEEVAYLSMMFLFGGSSLVIYYVAIEKKLPKI